MAKKRRRKKANLAHETDAESVVSEETDTVAEEVEASDDSEPTAGEPEETVTEQGETVEAESAEPGTEPEESEEGEESVDLAKELAEMTEKYMRTRAEMDNFRKRKAKEIDDVRRSAKVSAIEEIIPVMDQFQLAVSAMDGGADLDNVISGMKMIQTTFDRAFESLGVDKVPSVGYAFDPLVHEALSMEASEETPADHVVREWQSGYKIGDFLIRPASVVVSSGPETAEEPADDDAIEEAAE